MATRKPARKRSTPKPPETEAAALPLEESVGAPADDPPTAATPFTIPQGPGPILLGVDPSTGEATIDVPDGSEARWYMVGRRGDGPSNVGDTWLAPEHVRGLDCYVEVVPIGHPA